MTMGEKLRKLRKSTKKTLQQQSEVFSVSINTVYRWEHDMVLPRKETLAKIAKYYNLPVIWLMYDDSEQPDFPEGSTERQFVRLFQKLNKQDRYKVIGYMERMYFESLADLRRENVK